MTLNASEIGRRRLTNQHLTGRPFPTPEEAVGWLGAVQAQDYGPAKWSVAQRTAGVSDADMDRAVAAGTILRTHVLRPTWHFVLPQDIRWLLVATAPRILARTAYRRRQLGLEAAILRKSEKLLAHVLRGGNELTRREIGALLHGAGIDIEGQRLPHILMDAELHGVICSGPLHGRQHSYVLLDQRAPQARDFTRVEALGELAARYFTSHGPASAKDFAAWASLTVADVRKALDRAEPGLERDALDGVTLWSGASVPTSASARADSAPTVRLLQGYDEYIMGYSETRHAIRGSDDMRSSAARPNMNQAIILDGRVAGLWRRKLWRDSVVVEAALHEPFEIAQARALAAEAKRFGKFLGLSASVVVTGPQVDAASAPDA
jgi:hypothetical protein